MSFHADRDQVARWLDELDSLPPDRGAAVIRLLGEVVADCPVCGLPVTRSDRRAPSEAGLGHLDCVGPAPTPPAVA